MATLPARVKNILLNGFESAVSGISTSTDPFEIKYMLLPVCPIFTMASSFMYISSFIKGRISSTKFVGAVLRNETPEISGAQLCLEFFFNIFDTRIPDDFHS